MPIRFKILLACLALTSLTIGLGLFALAQQRDLSRLAMRIYDDAVMSISYLRSAESKFVDLRGRLAISGMKGTAADELSCLRASAASGPGELSERQALLAQARGQTGPAASQNVAAAGDGPVKGSIMRQAEVDKAIGEILGDLDVAIERAMSDDGRKAARALRESVAGISAGWNGAAAAKGIDAIAGAFDLLAEKFSADGLELRASAEDLAARGSRSTLIAIGASVAIALLITWALSVAIVPALRRAAKFAEDIADGRLDDAIVLPKRRGRSETAALLAALSRMQAAIRESLDRSERLRAEKTEAEQTQARLRKKELCKFADDFETAVGKIIDAVSQASSELDSSAGRLAATATRSKQLMTTATSASDAAYGNVQSVASTTEKMSSSVHDISRQVRDSAQIAGQAVEQAHRTNARVGALSQAAGRIGDVVKLIRKVAAQTNLLALNATIEAARAGEAGRGFAVVASEVKALAQQTAQATEDISQQIGDIQAATDESVAAIHEIGLTIDRMSEIASTISLAVQEQSAANQEISRHVRQAAQDTRQVSSDVADVRRGADETGSASIQVLNAAQSLAGDSSRLKHEVKRFLDTVRAA